MPSFGGMAASPSRQEVTSLTFLLCGPGSSGLSHLSADRLVSVLLLDGQRDDGNVRKFLSPAGPVLLNEHLGDPARGEGGRARRAKTCCVFFNELDQPTKSGPLLWHDPPQS